MMSRICAVLVCLGSESKDLLQTMENKAHPVTEIPQAAALHSALAAGQMPSDIACSIQSSLGAFQSNPALFDSDNLCGPLKQAELIVKLGFWLVVGRLSAHEFRNWSDCIPAQDNADWDVDFFRPEPGSATHTLLRLGPVFSQPETCLVQEAWWENKPF